MTPNLKLLLEWMEEWANADKRAADSLCMHSNNPSDEVLILLSIIRKQDEVLERAEYLCGGNIKCPEDAEILISKTLSEIEAMVSHESE